MTQNSNDAMDTGAVPRSAAAGRQDSGRLRRPPRRPLGGRHGSLARVDMGRPARRGARGLFITRWRWMAFVTLAVVAAAALLSWSRTPVYSASAEVRVQPRLYAAGTPPQAPDMGSEKAVASSALVRGLAARWLAVTPEELSHGLSVSVPLNTNVLHVAYSSTDPKQAKVRAQAIADAYVTYWMSQQPLIAGRPASSDLIVKTAVITPAALPLSPSSPNHVVDIAIAVVIGLVLAFGTAYVRDRFDDSLRSPGELEESVGAPILGLVPRVHPRRRERGRLITISQPDSPAAEAYRDLATQLIRVAERAGTKSMLVTSPLGDAQTTVSANLAVTLAKAGLQVVLVYADLRPPQGHDPFGMDGDTGLADVLEGRALLGEVLCQTDVSGLHVVPAGALVGDSGTALRSPAMRQALRRLRTSADVVVIDGPPALAGADAGTAAELADMVLVVGDARRTTRDQARIAAAQLERVRAEIVGCVMENFGRTGWVAGLSLAPGHNRNHREAGRHAGRPDDGTPGRAEPPADGAGASDDPGRTNGWKDHATTEMR